MSLKVRGVLQKFFVLIAFIILSGIVVYKALYIPITHDEKSATVYYATLPVKGIIESDIWPSNHILNSLLIKLCENLFGFEVWSVRLPNMLAFVLLFVATWLLAKRYFDKPALLFCVPFFVMFCNPFLLDFFGLARGYGLSNALLVCSVYCLLVFASSFRRQWYYATIVFAMLAAYANFTLLIFWVAVHILLISLYLYHAVKNKSSVADIAQRLFATALINAAFVALCYTPIVKMQATNQFVYWLKEDFYKNTVRDSVENFLYGRDYRYFNVTTLLKFITITTCTAIVLAGVRAIRNFGLLLTNPLFITGALLLLVWGVNMLQAGLLGTPYLSGRTALSYYVLFALLFMFTVREVITYIRALDWVLSPLIALFLGLHLYYAADFNHVREWWYDANTYRVLDYLDNYRKEHPETKTIDLNTNWHYHPSFSFYTITGKTPWLNLTDYHKETDTASQTMFYYVFFDDPPLKNYEKVMDFPWEGGALFKKVNP